MKKYIFMFVFFYSINAFPSEPAGISLFVKPLPSTMDYKYIIDGFFRNYYGPDNVKTLTRNSHDYIR
ncbi:TPA: hypothetical protein ACJIWP_000512 [Enterobacter cloacae]|nr:hypothetical protein [Enterobacter cloacae]